MKTLIAFGFAGILVTAFQNCAKANFMSSETSTASQSVSGSQEVGNDVRQIPSLPAILVPETETPPAPTNPTNPTSPDDRKECDGDRDDAASYRKICADASKSAAELAAGLNIENHSGQLNYKAASFNLIKNNSGKVILSRVASVKRGHIQMIDENSGVMIICGHDVDVVQSKSGKLVVVDANIGDVRQSSGVILVGGQITGRIGTISGTIRKLK